MLGHLGKNMHRFFCFLNNILFSEVKTNGVICFQIHIRKHIHVEHLQTKNCTSYFIYLKPLRALLVDVNK